MPTYGYECLSCKNQFEIFQSIKDDALTTCETCGGTLRKRVYPVGIAFKGSGFYVNDYAPKPQGSSSASADPAKSDTPKPDGGEAKSEPGTSEAKAEPKADTKADTKPEAKAETKPAAKTPGPVASS